MKNRRFILALTLLLGVVTCAFLFKNFKIERRSNSNAIFATSTKGNITMAEVDKYLANFRKNFGQNISLNGMKEEEKKIIAVDIFNNRIILEKAKAGGLANSKEYMEKLSEAKDSLLRAMFLENLVAENISDEMVKAKYAELMDSIKGKKEFDVSYIFVKEERDMNIVMKELEEHTFADVAASYSQDPGSKSSGGRIGWVLENSLTNEFSSVIKKLPINKLSKPFKTETGWYVMLKTGERDAVIPEFENAKASVRNAAIRDFLKNYSVTNTENLGIKLVE